MSVRHPPKNRVPPVVKRGQPRVVRYAAPDERFIKRWARRIFRPPVIIALVVLTTFTVGIFGYYYWIFSARIDRLISGEIYTRSAGIYTAPRELRVGTGLAEDDLVARLNTKTGEITEYLLPRTNTNIRRVFVEETGPRPVLWVGSNHGASIVKVEPLD